MGRTPWAISPMACCVAAGRPSVASGPTTATLALSMTGSRSLRRRRSTSSGVARAQTEGDEQWSNTILPLRETTVSETTVRTTMRTTGRTAPGTVDHQTEHIARATITGPHPPNEEGRIIGAASRLMERLVEERRSVATTRRVGVP